MTAPASGELQLQFLGGGKMAEALLVGLVGADWAGVEQLAVVERYEPRRDHLTTTYPGLVVGESPHAATATVLAVKPQDMHTAIASLTGLGPSRVLSIAAGVTTASLEATLDSGTAVVRSMPNTPALVAAGAAAIAPGSRASPADLDWAASILRSVGTVDVVTEVDLDAVTGLSGSGPAYFFALVEALTDAGVSLGLEAPVAARLARQTLIGAAGLLEHGDESPATLRENVTSPGGTTAAGLASLADDAFAEVINRAVSAATERSRELGQG